jgi:hypothetical protein
VTISPYRVQQTSSTTGTSSAYSLTVASTQFRNFRDAYLNGQNVPYVASDNTANYEIGMGTLVIGSPDTIIRDTIIASSNGGLAVNWSPGNRSIFAFGLDDSTYVSHALINYAIELGDWGTTFTYTAVSPVTLTLPVLAEVPLGWSITVKNSGEDLFLISPHGTDQIENLGGGTEWVCPYGASCTFTTDLTVWRQINRSDAIGGSIPITLFTTGVSPTVQNWGTTYVFTGSSPGTVTLPSLADIPLGYNIGFRNSGSFIVQFVPNGTDQIENFGASNTWSSPPAGGTEIASDGTVWRLINTKNAPGGSTFPILFTSTTNVHNANWGNTFIYTGSSSSVLLNLPALSGVPNGWQIAIKNSGTASISVTPNGADEIEAFGASNPWIAIPGACATFTTDGVIWRQTEISYPLAHSVRIFTGTGAVTATIADDILVIDKMTPVGTTITIPTAPPTGYTLTIVDGAGNANTYNLTVSAASNINGSTTYVMNANYQSTTFVFNGTQYNIIGEYYSGFGH